MYVCLCVCARTRAYVRVCIDVLKSRDSWISENISFTEMFQTKVVGFKNIYLLILLVWLYVDDVEGQIKVISIFF